MTIDSIKFGLSKIKPVSDPGQQTGPKSTETAGQPSFMDALKDAMSEVNQLQNSADQQIEGLVLKKDGISTHDAMIALEKADVAFQLMNTIRGKIIRAYEEVMRTQV